MRPRTRSLLHEVLTPLAILALIVGIMLAMAGCAANPIDLDGDGVISEAERIAHIEAVNRDRIADIRRGVDIADLLLDDEDFTPDDRKRADRLIGGLEAALESYIESLRAGSDDPTSREKFKGLLDAAFDALLEYEQFALEEAANE